MRKTESLIKKVVKNAGRDSLKRRFVDTDGTAYTCDGFRMYVERHTEEPPTDTPIAEPYPMESIKKILAEYAESKAIASVMIPTADALASLKVAKAFYKAHDANRVNVSVNGALVVSATAAEFGNVKTTITDDYVHDGAEIDKAAYDGRFLTEAIEFVAQKEDAFVCMAFAPIRYSDNHPTTGYAVTIDNGNGRSALLMGLHI